MVIVVVYDLQPKVWEWKEKKFQDKQKVWSIIEVHYRKFWQYMQKKKKKEGEKMSPLILALILIILKSF